MKNLGFLLLMAPLAVLAQKVENIKAAVEGEKIIITYDIIEALTGDRYDVQIYASHNNFSAPLQRVRGDVGNKLLPGTTKRIEWDAKAELRNFKGELTFEIRADVVGILILKEPVTNIKRGKSLSLAWRGGAKNQDVKVELLKAGTVQSTLATVGNNGSYQWMVPKKQKTGKDYQLRLASGKEVVTSETFSIKSKIPLVVKLLPLVAVGAVIGLSGGSGSGSSSSAKLPIPPDLGLD